MGTTPIAALPYPSLSDSPNSPAQTQSLATALDDKLVPRFATTTARDAAITAPVAGMICWTTTPATHWYYSGSAWVVAFVPASYTAYTPAWTATTTNPVIGNGTISGSSLQIGKMVHCWGSLTAGSTTTFGSGTYRLSLPVAADAALVDILGQIRVRDAGASDYWGGAQIVTSTTWSIAVSATYPAGNTWTPTAPFTFGNGDAVRWNFVYPAA